MSVRIEPKDVGALDEAVARCLAKRDGLDLPSPLGDYGPGSKIGKYMALATAARVAVLVEMHKIGFSTATVNEG